MDAISIEDRLVMGRIASRLVLAVPNLNDSHWIAIKKMSAKVSRLFKKLNACDKISEDNPDGRLTCSVNLFRSNKKFLTNLGRSVKDEWGKVSWVVEYESAYREVKEAGKMLVEVADNISDHYIRNVIPIIKQAPTLIENYRISGIDTPEHEKAAIKLKTAAHGFAISRHVLEVLPRIVWNNEVAIVDIYKKTAPSEFSYGGFKIINRYGLLKDEIGRTLKSIDNATQKLKSSGFGAAIYGQFVIRSNKEGMSSAFGSGHLAGGYYSPSEDLFVGFAPNAQASDSLIVHELGHRYWWKFLDGAQRNYWRGKFEERAGYTEETMRAVLVLTVQERREMWKIIKRAWMGWKFRKIDDRIARKFGGVALDKLTRYVLDYLQPKLDFKAYMISGFFAKWAKVLLCDERDFERFGIPKYEGNKGYDDWDYDEWLKSLPKGFMPLSRATIGGKECFSFERPPTRKQAQMFIGKGDYMPDWNATQIKLRINEYLKARGMSPASVSEYGTTNTQEDWAETFTAVVMKKRASEEAVDRFWRTVDKKW